LKHFSHHPNFPKFIAHDFTITRRTILDCADPDILPPTRAIAFLVILARFSLQHSNGVPFDCCKFDIPPSGIVFLVLLDKSYYIVVGLKWLLTIVLVIHAEQLNP